MVDGGTEGFKGNSRIICPTVTACLECNLDLYPQQGKVFKPIFSFESQKASVHFFLLFNFVGQ